MERDSGKYLWDACRAAEAVLRYTRDRTFEDYTSDDMLRSAAERQLQNVGEALAQLDRLDPESAKRIPRLRDVIGFRNILVHGYALLDNAVIWRVIENDLPALHADLTRLLDES